MAVVPGTLIVPPRLGDLDKLVYAKWVHTLTAALSTADTYEVDVFGTDATNGYDFIPVAGKVFGVRTDTNATPTGQFSIGDSADPDGLLIAKSGFATVTNSQPTQVRYEWDGALIKNKTRLTGTKIILTPTANPATGATSGDIFIEGWFRAVSKNFVG